MRVPPPFPPTDRPRGVGEHPHRGFETVTIVYQGKVAHRDSAGNGGTIGPGDVQWMTAASGVVHEELHEQAWAKDGRHATNDSTLGESSQGLKNGRTSLPNIAE